MIKFIIKFDGGPLNMLIIHECIPQMTERAYTQKRSKNITKSRTFQGAQYCFNNCLRVNTKLSQTSNVAFLDD